MGFVICDPSCVGSLMECCRQADVPRFVCNYAVGVHKCLWYFIKAITKVLYYKVLPDVIKGYAVIICLVGLEEIMPAKTLLNPFKSAYKRLKLY